MIHPCHELVLKDFITPVWYFFFTNTETVAVACMCFRLYSILTANVLCCSFVEHGFQEGLEAGSISGYEKGFALGIKHGSEINQEVSVHNFCQVRVCVDSFVIFNFVLI